MINYLFDALKHAKFHSIETKLFRYTYLTMHNFKL